MKGRLYILLKKGDDHSLKIYRLNKFIELNFINEITDVNDQFVNAFIISNKIASNVLLHSDKKITKIYEGKQG